MPGEFIPVERPPGSVDLEDLAAADYALEQALVYGNPEPLEKRLRSDAPLLRKERDVAADIIAEKLKRPPHRPADHPEELRNRGDHYLALCVWTLRVKGVSHERAVHQVKIDEQVSESTVRKAVRANKELFGNLFPRRSGKKLRT